MAKLEDGTDSSILTAVDTAHKALHVSTRPAQALGYYRWAAVSGLVTGVAANAELAQFRWSSATALALLQYLRVRFVLTTAFTTAQEMILEALPCAGWTVAGSGGTRISPSATNLMKRSNFSASAVATNDIGIATTGALTAGTKTIGSAALAQHGWGAGVGSTVVDMVMDLSNGSGEYPFVMLQNEGFVVRNGATAMGAGGVGKMSIELAWAEMSIAQFPNY